MAEYIEREKVIQTLKDNTTEMESDIYYGSNIGIPEDEIEDIVNEITAADVIEVVRCKDCKYFSSFEYSEQQGLCINHSGLNGIDACVSEDDFCSYGETRNTD